MNSNKQLNLLLSIVVAALCGGLCSARADDLGTAFTYQGRLVTSTGPASGTYELTFSLWDGLTSTNQIGTGLGPYSVTVTGGVFAVSLDFGPVFQGNLVYLEIAARTNGAATFTSLPRQPLTPAPNAIFAAHAASADFATRAASADGLPGVTVSPAGNVGVGTANPLQKLQVDGGDLLVRGTNNYAMNTRATLFLGDTYAYLTSDRGRGLRLGVWNSPDAVSVREGSGNVGIGTTNAQRRLDVSWGDVIVRGTNNYRTTGDRATIFMGDAYASIAAQYGRGLSLSSHNALDGLVLNENGNVGIGTTSPGSRLQVNGTVNATTLDLMGNPDQSGPAIALRNGFDFWGDGTGVGGWSHFIKTVNIGDPWGGGYDSRIEFCLNSSEDPAASIAPGVGNSLGLGITSYWDGMGQHISMLFLGQDRQTNSHSGIEYRATDPNGNGRNWQTWAGEDGKFHVYSFAGYEALTILSNGIVTAPVFAGNGAGLTNVSLPGMSNAPGTMLVHEMQTDQTAYCTTTITQSFSAGQTVWQSFIPQVSGHLGEVYFSGAGQGTISVYFGGGTNESWRLYGPVAAGAGSQIAIPDGVAITAGSPYTFLFTFTGSGSAEISTYDCYAAGSCVTNGTLSSGDLRFWTKNSAVYATNTFCSLTGLHVNGPAHADLFTCDGNAIISGEATVLALNITSDRNAKEQFRAVEPREVLEKVVRLPISNWQFKDQPGVRHLGPVAQDFYASFDLGRDDTHIATVDADGVALAAIQGLNEKVDDRDRQIARLRAENESLAARLSEIEKKLGLTGPGQPAPAGVR